MLAPIWGEHISSFDITVIDVDDDKILVVTNDGLFQLTNVIISGNITGAQPINKAGSCTESTAMTVVNGSIRSKLDRMTPGMKCHLAIVGSGNVNQSAIMVTADRFSGVWTEDLNTGWIMGVILFYISVYLIILTILLAIFKFAVIYIGFNWYWRWRENTRRTPSGTSDTIRYVRFEHGVELTTDMGSIISLIAQGKHTISQLEQYTGMRRSHIEYLIRRLRRLRLIDLKQIALSTHTRHAISINTTWEMTIRT